MNLNQVTVPSLDVGRPIEFYEQMGLKLIVRPLPKYARFKCPTRESTFSLHQTKEIPNGEGICVYFECEDLDDRVNELQKRGIKFELEPTDQSWFWREARLKDIDGNQLILFYAGENRINPPWKVK